VDHLVRAAVEQAAAGKSAPEVAARFHEGLAAALVASAWAISRERGIRYVALGGGCFQNRILLERVSQGLERLGARVLAPLELPANDGGIALGQALVALNRAAAGTRR
jgi:hydrogenase maturation protein HypF